MSAADKSPLVYEHTPATILPHLQAALPHSLPLLRRVQSAYQPAPCAIYATFSPHTDERPAVWIAVYVDRTDPGTSDVWIYSSVDAQPVGDDGQPVEQRDVASAQLWALLRRAKMTPPMGERILLVASVAPPTVALIRAMGVVLHTSSWRKYLLALPPARELPPGFRFGRVTDEHLPLVMSTSKIPRSANILRVCQNSAVFAEPSGNGSSSGGQQIVAWGYLAVDGCLTTLYVLPEFRRKGLARAVSAQVLREAADSDEGYLSHADVSEDNIESQGVCEALGGRHTGTVEWVRVDLEKLGEDTA